MSAPEFCEGGQLPFVSHTHEQACAQKSCAQGEPAYLEVRASVHYWEDAQVNGQEDTDGRTIPLRQLNCWCPVIRLCDGKVVGWPEGVVAMIHYKVIDEGDYWLRDAQMQRVAKWASAYVPDAFLCPGGSGWGDYIVMTIGADGFVRDWQAPAIVWARDNTDNEQQSWRRLSRPAEQP